MNMIALEGINRAGKGEQIKQLKSLFQAVQVAYLVLRGDGTREGLGQSAGDPYSEDWQERAMYLRKYGQTQDWNKAAAILAQELKEQRESNTDKVLILDRSLISRANFIIDRTGTKQTLHMEDLYPDLNVNFSWEAIIPDQIFELQAPKEVILSRLDETDPKYAFRKKLIERTYEVFYKAKEQLPLEIQDKIIPVKADTSIVKVTQQITSNLDFV